MKEFLNKTTILWDFDGVILDSMEIRELGFKRVLINYPMDQVNKLLSFHRKNGGLSRYVKFRFFFEQICGETSIEEKVDRASEEYSTIMRHMLISEERLIQEVLEFIKKERDNFNMHIVSGSDGNELRYICSQLKISKYFKSIEGSPTPKDELITNLIKREHYDPLQICLVGDSINDYHAAENNNILFYGFNNPELKEKGLNYIICFE